MRTLVEMNHKINPFFLLGTFNNRYFLLVNTKEKRDRGERLCPLSKVPFVIARKHYRAAGHCSSQQLRYLRLAEHALVQS